MMTAKQILEAIVELDDNGVARLFQAIDLGMMDEWHFYAFASDAADLSPDEWRITVKAALVNAAITEPSLTNYERHGIQTIEQRIDEATEGSVEVWLGEHGADPGIEVGGTSHVKLPIEDDIVGRD